MVSLFVVPLILTLAGLPQPASIARTSFSCLTKPRTPPTVTQIVVDRTSRLTRFTSNVGDEDGDAGVQNAIVIELPPDGVTQALLLLDGSRALGRTEAVTDEEITFHTTSGAVLTVPRNQIAGLARISGRVVKGSLWEDDPNPTRMLFGPTARSLRRGQSYIGVYEVITPFVQVGLTDRISIGGGTPPFITGDGAHPFWVTPKVQLFAGEKTQAAVGTLHITSIGNGGLGIAYGVVTHGTTDNAATIGVGYAYRRGDNVNGGAPVVMVAGESRVTRNVKLITENYLFRGGGLIGGGVRLLGERLSVDFALVAPLGTGTLFVVPVVNFVRRF